MWNVEVWIVMNENGEYEVGTDRDSAAERFDESFSGDARRVVKLNITMAPPKVIEADVDVADDAGEVVT